MLAYKQIIILLFIGTLFSGDNAYPLEQDSRQMGIFQPRIYGMSNNIEISTHPILFFIKPNIRVKKYHDEFMGFGLASRYGFDYPTLLLKLIQREGKYGILSKDPDIKEISNLFVFHGELLATKIFENSYITGKLGMSTCLGCELDSRHLFDYDLAYPRIALYHYGVGANMGLDYDYTHSEIISLKVDMDLLFLPQEHAFIEHKVLFHYSLSSKYTLSGGYKFCYGYYPFSKEQGLWNLFPLLDFSWKWKK